MPNLAYDPSTLLGQVRFHASDTVVDDADATFSDAELTYLLTLSQQDPILAASFALEALAADTARLAVMLKTEASTTDMKTLSQEIAARAQTLRTNSSLPPAVVSPDQVFSTDSLDGTVLGTMDIW